ncbi:hypothetical protein HGD85_02930 [Rhodobacteraceae bacterium R_SAG10]|nr:hypothetical protein [Rhodobacteraceae bacterium R_SAG10]
MTEVVTFSEAAPVMFSLGWQPIPLAEKTKRPVLQGWPWLNREPWIEADLADEIRRNGNCACGMAVGPNTVAIDIDIMDADVSAEVAGIAVKVLGETPLIRIGQAPKSMLIYRTDGTIRSRKLAPIELFAGSGQIAVFGWHEKAGRPYHWPKSDIMELATDCNDIPLVSAADIRGVLERLPDLSDFRPKRVGVGCSGGAAQFDGDHPLTRLNAALRRGIPWQAAASLTLTGAGEGERHNSVFAVIRSGAAQGVSEKRVRKLMARTAPNILEHVGENYVDRVCGRSIPPPFNATPAQHEGARAFFAVNL